jgi:hypothetical protein
MIGLGADAKGTAKGYRIHIFFLYCEMAIGLTFINKETVCFTDTSFLRR